MTKTIWILAIAAAFVAGTIATGTIAIADDDEEVEASIEAELELEQDGDDVEVEVEADGLKPNTSFTVRAYGLVVTAGPGNMVGDENTNCMRGAMNALAGFTDTSDGDGELEISGTILEADFDAKGLDNEVDSVESVSIRRTGSPPANPPVVCFQDTTP